MTNLKQALFPVAGEGRRLFPASRAVSKELFPLGGRALIDYAIEEALAAGAEKLIFITGDKGTALEAYLDWDESALAILAEQGQEEALALAKAQKRVEKHFIRQERPLGLGHAILCGKEILSSGAFAVLLPDDMMIADPPCLAQMAQAYRGGHMVALKEVPADDVGRYGIIDAAGEEGDLLSLAGLVEKPTPDKAPSTLAIMGRYILSSDIFTALENGRPGAGGEIQLTDALAARLQADGVWGWRFSGQRHDCGTWPGLAAAWQAVAG